MQSIEMDELVHYINTELSPSNGAIFGLAKLAKKKERLSRAQRQHPRPYLVETRAI